MHLVTHQVPTTAIEVAAPARRAVAKRAAAPLFPALSDAERDALLRAAMVALGFVALVLAR